MRTASSYDTRTASLQLIDTLVIPLAAALLIYSGLLITNPLHLLRADGYARKPGVTVSQERKNRRTKRLHLAKVFFISSSASHYTDTSTSIRLHMNITEPLRFKS
ncbi:hypothetical protein Q8A67_000456 [Cirrhinus molitorella]|uniref:Uncharacterized protein n=1 Tax=Cirrhinus molitorella TaxID=172907 RepID=A0AA88QCR3_9TELE|nr:hypothetical protein Q8A67_000456 [Cirrhinus molitorella]